MNRPRLTTLLVYLTLIAGAVLFSFPFVWLATSSIKVDRELYTKDLRVLPQEPLPRPISPYYENRRLDPLPGTAARQAEIIPGLQSLIRHRVPTLPPDAITAIADEEFAQLPDRAPGKLFTGPAAPLLEFAAGDLSNTRIQDLANDLKRELLIGPIEVRGEDTHDYKILDTTPPSQRWIVTPPNLATLTDDAEGIIRYARVSYDFSSSTETTIHLTAAAPLPFPGEKLSRVQIRMRPDDTWHNLEFSLDIAGRHYTCPRTDPLSNYQWTTLTWQFPSADDNSTRIKTWKVLTDAGTSTVTGPNMVMHLTLHRVNKLQAGYNKFILNFQRVLDQIPFWRYVRVSVFLVLANIALSLLFSSLAAYAFARITWPGREFCFILMLATMMIPSQVTMVPHFLIWKSIGAYNTLTPLWLGAAFGNAFYIFLLRQFMRGIPRDLEDAARIDGCGFLRIYWHVIVPLIKPSLAAIAIFTFIGSWNDFMGPLLYVADQRLYPLAFGLYAFSVQVYNNPTLTMAASLLITLPVILIFFSAQKYFIEGVTMTGMKG